MLTAQLIESREIGPLIRHFVFVVPEVENLDFQPGQFVSFVHTIDGKEITRAYSIASPPNRNVFELCLNLVREGHFSPYLFDLTPGSRVALQGILGTFFWRRPVGPSILVATGTGIAPFRGMLQQELSTSNDAPITLIFGARYPAGLVYSEEFTRMSIEHQRFRFLPTVTRPDENWRGRTGRVQPHLMEALGGSKDFRVYICGLKEMVDDVRAKLKELGFDRKQIVSEKYD